MDANESFEIAAEEFYQDTGFMAPGKDQPAAMMGTPSCEERYAAWKVWTKMRSKLTALRRELEEAKGEIDRLVYVKGLRDDEILSLRGATDILADEIIHTENRYKAKLAAANEAREKAEAKLLGVQKLRDEAMDGWHKEAITRKEAEAARDEAQGALCRAREALDRISDVDKSPVYGEVHILRTIARNAFLAPSAPCPHAAHEKALEEAVGWACDPARVFSHNGRGELTIVVEAKDLDADNVWVLFRDELRRRASAEKETS